MAEDFAELINQMPGNGWTKDMGVRITRATVDEVHCEWEVQEKHLQGYGIVHGGVHCGVIETIASVGAHLVAMSRGQRVVGLENHTSFIRAVSGGKLTAEARPVTRGRHTQVWEGWVRDAEGKLVARGSVRLICLEQTEKLAGRALEPGNAG
ncbi:MAG TPA: PaaI family thioesterase [Myxococcaceae bacterium]|nr:PaaI family thioesterase [Myxococcaceae bacterium]